jgi:SAM-dependent methyltransferase
VKLNQLDYTNNPTIDYDHIPVNIIGTNVLEIGVSQRLFLSALWKKRHEGQSPVNYTGIDVFPPQEVNCDHAHIIQANIVDYEFPEFTSEYWDTILSVQTFEHINLWDWAKVFAKLKDVLKPQGYMVITVPYKERYWDQLNFPTGLVKYHRYQQHLVHGITKEMMEYFLPGAKFFIKWRIMFRQDGANIIWATGRFVKRLFTRVFPPWRRTLYCIWQKQEYSSP